MQGTRGRLAHQRVLVSQRFDAAFGLPGNVVTNVCLDRRHAHLRVPALDCLAHERGGLCPDSGVAHLCQSRRPFDAESLVLQGTANGLDSARVVARTQGLGHTRADFLFLRAQCSDERLSGCARQIRESLDGAVAPPVILELCHERIDGTNVSDGCERSHDPTRVCTLGIAQG